MNKALRKRSKRYMYDKDRINTMLECELVYHIKNLSPGYKVYYQELKDRLGIKCFLFLPEKYISEMLFEYHLLVKTESSD